MRSHVTFVKVSPKVQWRSMHEEQWQLYTPQMWPNTFCFCHIVVDDSWVVSLSFGIFTCFGGAESRCNWICFKSLGGLVFWSFILIINLMQEIITSASGLWLPASTSVKIRMTIVMITSFESVWKRRYFMP